MPSYMENKAKEKAYIAAGPEFVVILHCKNLIIDKSLYGLKTSAARFHEHLSKSLLRLRLKKTKHDPDLWMVDGSSHYEYIATYVDDILIWSKDPMTVIKSLEKTYMLTSVGIAEYFFRWKCGIPWRSMVESGIKISSISKDLHSERHP
jgi:hypothetical protein